MYKTWDAVKQDSRLNNGSKIKYFYAQAKQMKPIKILGGGGGRVALAPPKVCPSYVRPLNIPH